MSKKLLNVFLLLFFFNCIIATGKEAKNKFIKVVNSGETVKICQDGKALLPIVISPKASDEIKKTAETLASILKKISGATFSIETKDKPDGITLGTLNQFPDNKLNSDMAVKDVYDGVESTAILTNNGIICLLGNTDLGVSHAMYRFLESFGYRWYFMSSKWEIIPKKKNLSCSINEIRRPCMLSRTFAFTRLAFKFQKGDPLQLDVFRRWKTANQVDESIRVRAAHAWNKIPHAFKMKKYPYREVFKKHPEYYALVNGKRTPDQLCVTNKDLQALVIDYANTYFELYPNETMVSLDPADTMKCCTCPECSKLGNISNQPFYLANIVAKELQKTHPTKLIGLLAYAWHSEPPKFKIESNILVQLTAGFNASKYNFDELLKLWQKSGVRLGVYEYFTYWDMDRCLMPAKGAHNALDDLKPRMKKLFDHGVRSYTAESANSWGAHGLGYLVAHQLMWNPDADIPAFKKDFYKNAFGPAASVMEKYYECLNLSNHPFKVVAMLRECSEYLQEAAEFAKDETEVLGRIDELRANMIYNYIGLKYDLERDPEKKKKIALEWFTWAYRIRNMYMIDWASFRAGMGNPKSKSSFSYKFKTPEWYYKNTKNPPWKNDTPIVHEELNKRMKDILSEWGKAPKVKQIDFSDNYVLVKANAKGRHHKTPGFLGKITHIMYSLNGEPLRFSITVRSSPHFKRQPGRYWLKTLDDKLIKYEELPEGKTNIELKVPTAGAYKFICKRGGPGWGLELPDDLPSALLFERSKDTRPHYSNYYFYVPKGTKKIIMYVGSGSLTIKNPKGKKLFNGFVHGDFIEVKIPPEQDGKVWSLSGKMRNIWFFNLPNILSKKPSQLIIPEELAKKDGLEIVN